MQWKFWPYPPPNSVPPLIPLSVLYSLLVRGFLDGSVVKNPPANAGDADSIPGSGRSPGEGNGNPLHYSCLGNPIDRRSLAGQNLWGYKRLRHNLASKQQQQLLISPTFEHSLSAAAKSLQSCPTLCNPRDGSPPGSPVPGILQARTLEWVAISFSNAWKWKVKKKKEKWKWSRSVMSDSQGPHGLQPTRLLRPWDFPGKSTGVGCHCLLQNPHCLPGNFLLDLKNSSSATSQFLFL